MRSDHIQNIEDVREVTLRIFKIKLRCKDDPAMMQKLNALNSQASNLASEFEAAQRQLQGF